MLIAEVEQKVNLTHLLISGFFLSSSLTPPPSTVACKVKSQISPFLSPAIPTCPPPPHSHRSSFSSAFTSVLFLLRIPTNCTPPSTRVCIILRRCSGPCRGCYSPVYSRRLFASSMCIRKRAHRHTQTHTDTHTQTHTQTRARARARAHTHTHRGRVPPVAQAQEPAGKCQCQN